MVSVATESDEQLPWDLAHLYGAYVPLSVAWRWMSFSSLEAARCAWRRGKMPVPCIRLNHRRGLFLPVYPLAHWLQAQGLDDIRLLAPRFHRRNIL